MFVLSANLKTPKNKLTSESCFFNEIPVHCNGLTCTQITEVYGNLQKMNFTVLRGKPFYSHASLVIANISRREPVFDVWLLYQQDCERVICRQNVLS